MSEGQTSFEMLQTRAGVKSARTVTRTLAACGIDPKQALFSENEVQRFYEARQLIDGSKYSYAQVSEHFGVADATATAPSEEPEAPASNGAAPHGTNPFYEQAQQAAREYVQETTDRVVKDALAQLPAILDQTFQELAASGYVQEAFARDFAEYQARYDAEAKGPRQVYESPGFSLGSGGNTLDEDEEFTDTHNQEDIVDVSNTTTFDENNDDYSDDSDA